jgi:hypothetical protein
METFTNLEEGDILSTTMGDSGSDMKFSPAARKVFPFSVEARHRRKFPCASGGSKLRQTQPKTCSIVDHQAVP